MISATLVREEARKVIRAHRAWEWIARHIEENPPPADGFRHPQVDLEDIAAEALVRSVRDLARLTSLDEDHLVFAIVDAGLDGAAAEQLVARHRTWIAEEAR